MGDDGAEDTGEVSGGEGDSELGGFGVFRFGFGVKNSDVHLFNNGFEGDEFNDSVGDLSGPKGGEGFKHSLGSFIGFQFIEGGNHINGVDTGFGSLHLDFEGFPWAEEGVGDDFSTGRRDGPANFSVSLESFLSENSSRDVFEKLVKPEFSETLEGISDESGSESEGKGTHSSFSSNTLNSSNHGFVQVGVNLSSAFNKIDGGDSGVGKTTSHSSSEHAFKIVREIVFNVCGHCYY